MEQNHLRIVFMGTPEFAVATLKALIDNKHNVVGVITVPDKPAGRGQQILQSPVKKYAIENGIPILQPEKLKDPIFLQKLKDLKPELQVVVAFRMLPEAVWTLPAYGTFNVHASLLPQYRGAAPINWAIINGEKESGVTTFFLQHEIDTGKIIFQTKITVSENENAETLHNKLMLEGASIALKTIDAIESGNCPQIDQNILIDTNKPLKTAPKIFKENCKINWTKSAENIYNFIRGLSPYPTAWTKIKINSGEIFSFKIFETSFMQESHSFKNEFIISDKKRFLKVAVEDGFINIISLQQAGKKRLNIEEFLRGFTYSELEIVL